MNINLHYNRMFWQSRTFRQNTGNVTKYGATIFTPQSPIISGNPTQTTPSSTFRTTYELCNERFSSTSTNLTSQILQEEGWSLKWPLQCLTPSSISKQHFHETAESRILLFRSKSVKSSSVNINNVNPHECCQVWVHRAAHCKLWRNLRLQLRDKFRLFADQTQQYISHH